MDVKTMGRFWRPWERWITRVARIGSAFWNAIGLLEAQTHDGPRLPKPGARNPGLPKGSKLFERPTLPDDHWLLSKP